MEKRKKLIGAKRTHRGRLEVRSLWAEHETIALINSCVMMGYSDLGKYVHDLAAGTLTEMLKKALEKKKNEAGDVGNGAGGDGEASGAQKGAS